MDNPIYNSDPLGNTTLPRPDGVNIDIGDAQFEVFDGRANLAGNTKVQPAAGTLKSFTKNGILKVVDKVTYKPMPDENLSKFIYNE